MEDMGEAVKDAITTATVGASFLNPLTMRNGPTVPIGTKKKHDRLKLGNNSCHCGGEIHLIIKLEVLVT